MRSKPGPALLALALLAGCGGPPASPADGARAPSATALIIASPPPTFPSPAPTSAPPPTIVPTPSTGPLPTIVPTQVGSLPPTALPSPVPAPGSDEERLARLYAIINGIRTEQGLPAYQLDAGLSAAAHEHSCDLATHHYIDHVTSDGRPYAELIPAADPPWMWPSESIAAGSDDPQVIVAMWMDEPPDGWHRRNILDAEQQAIGVGYCRSSDDPTGNTHYWTMIVARR
jgi:uncharacterized protein YkwD